MPDAVCQMNQPFQYRQQRDLTISKALFWLVPWYPLAAERFMRSIRGTPAVYACMVSSYVIVWDPASNYHRQSEKKQEIGLALARDSEIDEPKKGLSFRFRLHPGNSPAVHLVPRLYTTEVKASPPNLANYKLIFDASKSCVGIFLHFNKKCIFSITFSPFLLAFQIRGIGPCVETSLNLSYAITGVCKWSLSKCRPYVIPAEQFLGVELPSRSMGQLESANGDHDKPIAGVQRWKKFCRSCRWLELKCNWRQGDNEPACVVYSSSYYTCMGEEYVKSIWQTSSNSKPRNGSTMS